MRICAAKSRLNMQKVIKFTIFETKWGYFGLAGCKNGLLKTHLPLRNRQTVEKYLLRGLSNCRYEKSFFQSLVLQIRDYFEGRSVEFNRQVPLIIDRPGEFSRQVLFACRDIKFGRTISYSKLAESIGRVGAGRAVGRALAANPLPLIVPCHRVICSNGRIGGFSAAGGQNLKKKLLLHEKQQHSA